MICNRLLEIQNGEIALFNLFNRIKANGKTLLVVSAVQSPTALPVKLPDLASRLKWGESYQLIPLSDEQILAVLKQNAHQRGIMLSDDTANFYIYSSRSRYGDIKRGVSSTR